MNFVVDYKRRGKMEWRDYILPEPVHVPGLEFARACGQLGGLYRRLGENVKAEELFQRAKSIFAAIPCEILYQMYRKDELYGTTPVH